MGKSTMAVPLQASHKGQAAVVLAEAFFQDPLYQAVFPSSVQRQRALRRLCAAVVGYSLRYGRVETIPGPKGVACWLSPGNTEVRLGRMIRTGLGFQRAMLRLSPDKRQLLLSLLAVMHARHEALVTGPHWYLWALGINPQHQGQGLGSVLLDPILEAADREGVPCYLETQSERSLPFYQRHGFRVVKQGPVGEQGLMVWHMLR